MDMKPCVRCGVAKPRTDFYASRVSTCKECVRALVAQRRLVKIDEVRAYDRARATLPHRIANATRVTREWRRRHPERQRAHNAAHNAHMDKPVSCEGCGREARLDGHHPDYAKPLLVIWLCKPCHVIADKIRRRLEESAEKAS